MRRGKSDTMSLMSKSQTARLLSELEVGIIPGDVFYEIARLIAITATEIVPLRIKNGKVEVLLLRRPKDDPIWPNLWHTPGSVVRSYDTKPDFQDAIERVLNDELLGVKTSEPCFVKNTFNQSKRGKEVGLIYWVEVIGKPSVGQFFDIDDLPSDRVSTQPFITDAVNSFLELKS